MAIKIAVTNHKGGVGKTMTTFNLGAALAELGEKVLLIDSDGQCNLTMQSGANVEGASNLSTYLNDDDVEIKPVSINENLWIIPGSTALDEDAHNIELSIEDDINGATHYLADILKKIENSYNYILIDSAPSSGAILVNVIVAADKLIVPIADKFSITGAKKLTQIIKANHKTIEGKYLLTKQTKFGVSKQIRKMLTTQSPDALFHTSIRQCEDLNKSAALSQSIFVFSPKSNGAEDYMSLAKEIIGSKKDEEMPF